MQVFIATDCKVYKEPKNGQVESGLAYSRFSIAIPKQTKSGAEATDFFNVIAWGKVAERTQNLKKGDALTVKGEFHSNSYEDAQGVKKYSVELVLSDVEIKSAIREEPQYPLDDDDCPF